MTLDPRLAAILVCPQDRQFLYDLGDALYNPRLRLRYEVRDGIPVMLVDEATHLDDAEHADLIARIERDGVPSTHGGV